MYSFNVIDKWHQLPSVKIREGFVLMSSSWDDYTYKTTFILYYKARDVNNLVEIGNIKIGYHDQKEETRTYDRIPKDFTSIPSEFFSLAGSPEFYEKLFNMFGEASKDILSCLNCIVVDFEIFHRAKEKSVFNESLMRDVNINTVMGQFRRILRGERKRIRFDFSFVRKGHTYSDLDLQFNVDPHTLPPSNIQAIVGRNGLGKTTLLNEMVGSLVGNEKPEGAAFYDELGLEIDKGFFSTVVSVSFSAFDPFKPLNEQNDQKKGTCYYYIGLKLQDSSDSESNDENSSCKASNEFDAKKVDDSILSLSKLREKYARSVARCFSDKAKQDLWMDAISKLESDTNFKDLNLKNLANVDEDEVVNVCMDRMERMSSGHAVVFMTITRLVEILQEKTLVLFDEPESHLHPPLLSAFIRSLSSLLSKRNGVAIMATHSPVVVQEIPRESCWILSRFGDATSYVRPSIETFAENIGVLTKEIFSFEVENSGFHQLFSEKVNEGHSYEDIVDMFHNKIGSEGLAILMVMVNMRRKKNSAGGFNA